MHKSKGKLSGVLHKGFKPDKCKIALKMAMARIKLLRNKKEVQMRQMRREVAQLLGGDQDQTARIRVEHVIREEKFMQAYDLIEVYCELIVARMSIIDSQKSCPIDLKEAIASVIFASMRCSDVTELADVRKHFTSKYGKEFATSALEVRPDSGVNRLVIEKLSAGAPDVQTKTKTLSSIAAEHNIKWEPKAFEEELQKQNEDLLYGSTTYSGGNIPTMRSSASSIPTPQPATPYSSVESATSRMPAAPSEVQANRNPYGTANSNAFSQENRRGSDASGPSSQHVGTTYSSAEIPGSNSFSHENTGRPYSQYGATVPGTDEDTISRNEEINRPRERKSSASGSWNVEFKDATSAAQAAAASAEMASIAARAAAQLASRGNFSVEQNTGAYESAAYIHETTPRKQQADRLMKDGKRSSSEQSSGINDPRTVSSNARKDADRAETNRVDSQNMSTPYSSAQFHSYGPESRTDVYGMPTEPPRDHLPEPPYFDDSSEKESNIGRPEDHPFDLPGERLPDSGLGGHNANDMESRQASFDQENTNNYYNNFSSSHGGSSTIWDNQNDKTGADSSAVAFDQYDSDVEEENLLDPFSSKHTEELPTVQDHNRFSSADWSQQPSSESPVDHSTSTLFSRTETRPSYDLGANRKDITSPHSYDSMPPTFDSGAVSSDEEITTGMHVESLRSHSRGSDFSENKRVNRTSGKLVPDVNDGIEDFGFRSRKQYQNPPGFNVFQKEQHDDRSPRSDYSGAQGNLGRVQSREYDLSEEETEPHKLKGASLEKTGANDDQPLSFGMQTSATSDDNDEGDLGLNLGRLTPGLRNKLRQPPPYKNSGGNMLPKQSLHKAPASIEESVHSRENDTSFEQARDNPKSSRKTKNSFGANYDSELSDRKQSVGKPVESRSSMTRNYFDSGDTGKFSGQSGTTNPITTKSSVSANSSQDLHHDKPGIGAHRENRSRNARTYFDSDDSEEELERQEAGPTKLSREQIQSRRTREVTSNTKRDGRVRTGAQYVNETAGMPNQTKLPAEAFSNSSTEQRREAPAHSKVSVQQSSPKPVRIQPPTARGKWQEDELDGSSSPENDGNTETSAATPKESTSGTAPAHVHPKLPTDYDSFAAHFRSLRTNRR